MFKDRPVRVMAVKVALSRTSSPSTSLSQEAAAVGEAPVGPVVQSSTALQGHHPHICSVRRQNLDHLHRKDSQPSLTHK